MSPQTVVATSDPNPVDPRAKGALKHGLTGARLYFATPEDAEAFDQLRAALLTELAPANDLERDLALQIVCDRWRLISAAELESKIFHLACQSNPQENPHIVQAQTWLQDSAQISRISLYEARIQARCSKNSAEYRRMQAERIAERTAVLETAKEEAVQLAELGASLDDIAEPFKRYGFDFSPTQLAALVAIHGQPISREDRLADLAGALKSA